MKKILVAGGAGYIGSACAEYLLDRDYEVVVFDALFTGHRDAVDPRARFIKGDLAERDELIALCKKEKFDAVMHFAAFSLVGESMQNPSKYFRNNLASAINLADAAVESGVQSFVFSSTAATFGIPDEMPISERASQIPINPYGESKLCFEKVLHWYSEIHGLKYAALRYFNAAGATALHGEDHRPESHLIPLVLQTVRGKREKFMLFGDDYETPDGSCIRDYIHILDLAQAHEKALYAKESGHYNLGTGNGYSVLDMVHTFERVNGMKIPYQITDRRPGDIGECYADASKAFEEIGWKAERGLEEMCRSAWIFESNCK